MISRSPRPALSLSLLLAFVGASSLAGQPPARRWIVDNSVAKPGDGSARAPFNTLAAAIEAAGPGDTIALQSSTRPYQGGIALESGQSLTGEKGTVVIEADGDVVRVSATSGDVAIANVSLRAHAGGAGLVVENTKGTVTLRDVFVTTSGGTGIAVKKATKLVVTGASAVAATDAPAVSIEDSALDAVFRSLSASGRVANGVVLRKTTGRFTVSGKDGQRGSGGTIDGAGERGISAVDASNVTFQWMNVTRGGGATGVPPTACGSDLVTGTNERCNAGVYLVRVDGAVLDNMMIDSGAQVGIVAHGVKNLSILSCEVRNAGDELFEHGLLLEDLLGECRIVGSKVVKSASRHLMLHNDSGSLKLLIERSTFSDNAGPHGQQAVLVSAAGSANIEATVKGSSFARSVSHALDVTGTGQSKIKLSVTGSSFAGNATAISVSGTGRSTVQYMIADNPAIAGSTGSAINVYLGQPSFGTMAGTIARNTIGRSGVAGSGSGCSSCSGIALTANGNGTLSSEISGNVVQQVGGSGIAASAGQGGAQMRLTITSNLLRQPGGSGAPAIRVNSGTAAADVTSVCADVGGPGAKANSIEGTWQPDGDIHLIHRFASTQFRVGGLGAEKSEAATSASVSSRNRGAKVRAVLRAESKARGFEPAVGCTIQGSNR